MTSLKLTATAKLLLERRYLRRNNKGDVIETPEQMMNRVAFNIACGDGKYSNSPDLLVSRKSKRMQYWERCRTGEFLSLLKKDSEVKATAKTFYKMLLNLDFLPNSPCLYNAGLYFQQLAACFVIPIEDSMHSIFEAVYHTAMIHQSGGGTGFNFSRLRPAGSLVKATGGGASGPVNFMQIFDAATEQIKQGGKRKGANMAILSVHHPDIMKFIDCKKDPLVMNNFNISVAASRQFMRAVKNDETYPLINPVNGRVVARRNARRVFRQLCSTAHSFADPGIVFMDTINKANPTPHIGKIESTNPCGEMPLLPYEACNLGSINVSNFVIEKKEVVDEKDGVNEEKKEERENEKKIDSKKENKKDSTPEYVIDYDRLKETIGTSIHFLDNMIDMCRYPLSQIYDIVKRNRKVGLGVMGFAEMLFQLGVAYDSDEGRQVAHDLMKFINEEAKKASAELAKQRGVFLNYKGSKYDTGDKENRVRNSTRTTISPTGSISVIAGCSSSIEPLFALVYTKTIFTTNKKVYVVNKYFKKALKDAGIYSEELMQKVAETGTCGHIEEIPKEIRKVFVTATEVAPEDHIKMQATFQKFVDNGVSKTVNLPADATTRDVGKIYMMAYDLGCKGTTVYRYGSLEGQVQTMGKQKKEASIPSDKKIEERDEKQLKKDQKVVEKKLQKIIVELKKFDEPKKKPKKAKRKVTKKKPKLGKGQKKLTDMGKKKE